MNKVCFGRNILRDVKNGILRLLDASEANHWHSDYMIDIFQYDDGDYRIFIEGCWGLERLRSKLNQMNGFNFKAPDYYCGSSDYPSIVSKIDLDMIRRYRLNAIH